MIFPDTRAATDVSGTWFSPTVEHFHGHLNSTKYVISRSLIFLRSAERSVQMRYGYLNAMHKEAQRRDNITCAYSCLSDLKLY